MRRVLAACAILGSLPACSETSSSPAPSAVKEAARGAPREVFSPTSPKPLRLIIFVTALESGARIAGDTNLPDGTLLMLSLGRGPVNGGDKVEVSGGKFSADVYPKEGASIPPGQYEVSISTPMGDLQPAGVKGQLGSDYEALTGPLLRFGSFGARLIQYETKVNLGGVVNPDADRAARKQAYREHEEFSRRSCGSNPATVEKLTGVKMSAHQRNLSIERCLREMEVSRRDLVAQGLIEK
jgi:hypothetical protein